MISTTSLCLPPPHTPRKNMGLAPYFSTVTSESVFRARFQAEKARPFSELHHVAASNWGRSHLLACRVLRREPVRQILPILSDYTIPSDVHPSSSDEIRAFLNGPDPTFTTQSEHYLVRRSNNVTTLGQIWAALATFVGSPDRRSRDLSGTPEGDEFDDDHYIEVEPRPTRFRCNSIQDNFLDSSRIQIGSSSPLHDSSQRTPSSLGYVDSDSHLLGVAPEDETLRLASCVIRHILYFAPPQDSLTEPTVVEFCDAKTRLAASTIVGQRSIVAIDDSSLCLRRQEPGRGFIAVKDRIALLEAKTQFQCLENGRPIISDSCLAQMVCEALAARLLDFVQGSHQSVIVINATQHYMCFLQFDISDEYILDFEDESSANFLHVSSTAWYDISQRSGREHVLANICAIMRLARA
ncbi:hypothetical protein BDV25DRAFT_146536 [Aspergillus avenaceus]|uniref:Uncharacterized protein n=1 Tax=Aspergillus avenaceus TaxID=36643 RepID=A0A5N6UA69_ASPAV|nr:hypothetical protein BDV25DRAFT_146536 [Aspergillus avenaceus]